MREVQFDAALRRGNNVTLFTEDLPKAKVGEKVLASCGIERFFAEVTRATSFSVILELAEPVPSGWAEHVQHPHPAEKGFPVLDGTNVTEMGVVDAPVAYPPGTEVHYAHSIGGYVLIAPVSKERLCTPHMLMSDIGKIAAQREWIIVGRGNL